MRTLLRRAVLIPVCVLTLLAIVLIWQVAHLLNSSDRVAQIDRILSQASHTERLLVDMETGLRGYLLADKIPDYAQEQRRVFLEPYDQALPQIESAVRTLGDLTAGDPQLRTKADQVAAQIPGWLLYASQRRNGQLDQQIVDADLHDGKTRMDKIRQALVDLQRTATAYRLERERTASAVAQTTLVLSLSLTAAVGLLLGTITRGQLFSLGDSYNDAVAQARNEAVNARESEARFRTLVEIAPQTVWLCDASGQLVYSNRWWQEYVGLTMTGSQGTGWLEAVEPAHRDAVIKKWREAFSLDRGYEMHIPLRRAADGAYRWHLARGMPVVEAGGRIEHWICVAVDIDDARRAEAALRQSEERLREMADAMPQIVWIARPDGYHEYHNRRWSDYTGLTLEQSLGSHWTDPLHSDDRLKSLDRWHRALQTGELYETEHRFRRAQDGEYRWFLARALPVRDDTGRIVRWFGTCTDIHDNKLADEERNRLLGEAQRARGDAENANRLKDEFLATLSHELRTPLNAIVGWSQMLLHDVDPAMQREGLETIERNAKAQAQLIDDLLDVSRIISGKLRLDVQRVELPPVIDAAIAAVQHSADARGIRIVTTLDPAPPAVWGDPGRLQQVLWNLLSNAIKFTPRDGRVQVTLTRVASQIDVIVSDNGRGIDPAFLPFVFERFRQADSSTTRKFGGLGLGLAIVRHLVELHGGTVAVHSEGIDRGASFTVRLPITTIRRDVIEESHPISPEPPTRGIDCPPGIAGLTVLVVDDEPDTRVFIRRLLERCGTTVRVASSVEEAMTALSLEKFDVLLSDIGMPDEDGYELIRRVRSSDTGFSRLPAIALTAFARTEDRRKALRSGFQLHLPKPVDPGELLAAIAGAAGRTLETSAWEQSGDD